jgi:ATP synthase subunit 6
MKKNLFDIIEQFDVFNIFNYKYISIYYIENLLIIVFVLICFYFITISYNNLITFYFLQVLTSLNINLKSKFINDDFFLPNIFLFHSIFFIIVFENLTSMIPDTITITAFIKLPLLLSITFFGSSILIAIYQKKFKFFSGFLPKGVPLAIAPVLFIIEIISFLIRVFSLAIRLFINLLAGHILLKFIAIVMLLLVTILSDLVILNFLIDGLKIFLILLELLACLLQAVILVSLITIYLDQSLNFIH